VRLVYWPSHRPLWTHSKTQKNISNLVSLSLSLAFEAQQQQQQSAQLCIYISCRSIWFFLLFFSGFPIFFFDLIEMELFFFFFRGLIMRWGRNDCALFFPLHIYTHPIPSLSSMLHLQKITHLNVHFSLECYSFFFFRGGNWTLFLKGKMNFGRWRRSRRRLRVVVWSHTTT
jgi:hypothetical protein